MPNETPFDPRQSNKPQEVVRALIYLGYSKDELLALGSMDYLSRDAMQDHFIDAGASVRARPQVQTAMELAAKAIEEKRSFPFESALDAYNAQKHGLIRHGQDDTYHVVNAVLTAHHVPNAPRMQMQSAIMNDLEFYMPSSVDKSETPWLACMQHDHAQLMRLEKNLTRFPLDESEGKTPATPTQLAQEIYGKLILARVVKSKDLQGLLMAEIIPRVESHQPRDAQFTRIQGLLQQSAERYAKSQFNPNPETAEREAWNSLTTLYADHGIDPANLVAHRVMQALAQSAQAKPVDMALVNARAQTAVTQEAYRALQEKMMLGSILPVRPGEGTDPKTQLAKAVTGQISALNKMLEYYHRVPGQLQDVTKEELRTQLTQLEEHLQPLTESHKEFGTPVPLSDKHCTPKAAPRVWLDRLKQDQPGQDRPNPASGRTI